MIIFIIISFVDYFLDYLFYKKSEISEKLLSQFPKAEGDIFNLHGLYE